MWDLPLVPATYPSEPKGYMDRVKLLHYNAVFMVLTETPQPNTVEVFLEARSMQQQTMYFIFLASVNDTEKSLVEKKKSSLNVLTSQARTNTNVYLVRPSTLEKFDFPALLEDTSQRSELKLSF